MFAFPLLICAMRFPRQIRRHIVLPITVKMGYFYLRSSISIECMAYIPMHCPFCAGTETDVEIAFTRNPRLQDSAGDTTEASCPANHLYDFSVDRPDATQCRRLIPRMARYDFPDFHGVRSCRPNGPKAGGGHPLFGGYTIQWLSIAALLPGLAPRITSQSNHRCCRSTTGTPSAQSRRRSWCADRFRSAPGSGCG